jgi:ABC-2 type transport system ATP-binding protein
VSTVAPATNGTPAIEVCDLSKRYRGGILANDRISFSILKGTVFGLLGPNGAGKTTLVRQITGELSPTKGEVRMYGRDILRHPLAAKALMGVVPQEASPYLHLKPGEHLQLFGRLHGLDRAAARRRAAELVAALGLSRARVSADHLSGGLKRKLLVGIALMAEPPVLVLDEPTTALDPHSRHEVWALVRSLRGRGTTVSSQPTTWRRLKPLCDRVAVMGRRPHPPWAPSTSCGASAAAATRRLSAERTGTSARRCTAPPTRRSWTSSPVGASTRVRHR